MGVYYVLYNITRAEAIYGYWKADPFCSIYQVMHQFRWEPTDKIVSASYCSGHKFKYDPETKDFDFSDMYYPTEDSEECEHSSDSITFTDYKYDQKLDNNYLMCHIPEFDDNHKCQKCGYQFLPSNKVLATKEDMIWR
jgi:hypothetical protein